MTLLQSGLAKSLAEDYTIDNSLRFNEGDTPYLSKTFAVEGNRKTWTLSVWAKRAETGDGHNFFGAGPTPGTNLFNDIYFGSDDKITSYLYTGSTIWVISTEAVFRDPAAWYHIVLAVDTTQATDTNRLKLYVNGELQALSTATYPPQDTEGYINDNIEHKIGEYFGSGEGEHYNGYLAEFYFIDGTALTPSSFGELSSTTNQWRPIDASGLTFGTNGFYQKYSSTELAASFADSSGGYLAPAGVTSVEYLVVGGGGGGGGTIGGGGGAGGFRTGTLAVTAGTHYTVTVGAAGAAGAVAANGSDGGDSVFATITATGGGGGGSDDPENGRDGGSGGGGGTDGGPDAVGSGGSSTAYGNDGGSAYDSSPTFAGGGGGGSGAVGGNGATGGDGGDGGAGTANSITGASVTYAGGGGGSGRGTGGVGGTGGSGGGGNGSSNYNGGGAAGTAGTANTGSGGGGGDQSGGSAAGGSGIVIIKDSKGTVTSYTTSQGTVHTITANGDVTNTRAVRKIGDSSIKFDGTGDYLSIPDSTDWSYGTDNLTIEMWVNLSTTSGTQYLWSQITDSNNEHSCYISSGTIYWQALNASAWVFTGLAASTVTVSADVWTHLAFVRNGTTFSIYKDGVSGDSTTSSSAFADLAEPLEIGREEGGSSYINGYLDELRISNSARYTGTFTPQTTAFTADANTLLLIHSNWTGGLGADSSGNYNTFTATNLVATDQMIDTPTNNFATLNPVLYSSEAYRFAEGNLEFINPAGSYVGTSNWWKALSTIDMTSGKWYFEYRCTANGGSPIQTYGIVPNTIPDTIPNMFGQYVGQKAAEWGYHSAGGNVQTGSVATSTGYDTYAVGDIMSCALDLDNNKVYWAKNNTWQNSGDPTSGATGTGAQTVATAGVSSWMFGITTHEADGVANCGQDSSFAGNLTAQGNQDGNEKGDFYYTPPSGYLALCTDNLSTPEIKLPGDNFNTVLYSGNSTADRAVTGVGFAEDFAWIKTRTGGVENHTWCDVVRGTGNHLRSDSTAAQIDSLGVTSFDSDGFTLPNHNQVNGSGYTYVAWNWKAGGAPTVDNSAGAGATPTAGSVKIDGSNLGSALAGSIAATRLSANTTAGFSVVEFTGTAVGGATFAHGLSVAPELVILKTPSEINLWRIGFNAGTSNSGFNAPLKFTNAAQGSTDGGFFDTTLPSTSVVTLGYWTDVNSTNGMIAYCFHSVEGYSKVGSYEGNGVADGTFIYTGFKPAFVLIKSANDIRNWIIHDNKRDPFNVTSEDLMPNLSDAETTADRFDFLSNGFKNRSSSSANNRNGYSIIYIAFAESPFKTSNAR